MAPNAVTTGHCQSQLRPGDPVSPLSLADPGQSPDWVVEGEAGSPRAPAFYHTEK